jgi:hypothetical protein
MGFLHALFLEVIVDELKIQVVTFIRSAQGRVAIHGLEGLK